MTRAIEATALADTLGVGVDSVVYGEAGFWAIAVITPASKDVYFQHLAQRRSGAPAAASTPLRLASV